MTLETITCPACGTQLLSGKSPQAQVLLCAGCGSQFRSSGTWPLVRTCRKAIASLILGLLAFAILIVIRFRAVSLLGSWQVLFPLIICGVSTFFLGLWALGEIRREQQTGTLTGKSMAFLGAALGGALSLTVFIVPLLAVNIPPNTGRTTQSPPPPPTVPPGAVTIIAPGANWKWLHPVNAVDPAESDPDFHQTFFHLDFDDTGWRTSIEPAGLGGFGYGDRVAVDIGKPAEGDRKTAYFRHRFTTAEVFDELLLTYYRDDGVILYLDGREMGRDNVSNAPEAYELRAANTIGVRLETAIKGIGIEDKLEPGEHVLAISLHNAEFDSTDLRLGRITLYGIPSTPDQP